jgi:excisionase family DNA binding protein
MADKVVSMYMVPIQRGFQIDEAAKYLGIHPMTLRKLSDTRAIRCKRVNKHRVFLLEDLNSWLEGHQDWAANGNC